MSLRWFAGGPVGSQMVQRGGAGEASAREAQADRWWQSEGQPATSTARGAAQPAPAGEITGSDFSKYPHIRNWLGRMKALKSWKQINEAIDGYGASLKGTPMVAV